MAKDPVKAVSGSRGKLNLEIVTASPLPVLDADSEFDAIAQRHPSRDLGNTR